MQAFLDTITPEQIAAENVYRRAQNKTTKKKKRPLLRCASSLFPLPIKKAPTSDLHSSPALVAETRRPPFPRATGTSAT